MSKKFVTAGMEAAGKCLAVGVWDGASHEDWRGCRHHCNAARWHGIRQAPPSRGKLCCSHSRPQLPLREKLPAHIAPQDAS